MKIKESLKNTKEKIAKGYEKYGKKILLVGAGLSLTYIGCKAGHDYTMWRIDRGLKGLHEEGFLQFNDPMTGRKDISVKECGEAVKRRKKK